MASGRGQNGDVVQTRRCELSEWDKREIQQTSNYAKQHEKKLKELADEFDSKGNLGLFWDSKVPAKDKWLFYFFTFRCTDPEEVKAEIEKYLQFYQKMSEIASRVGADEDDDEADASQRNEDALNLIKELKGHLTKLERAAEAGVETTGSQAVYDQHREFVAKHEKLEHLIKGVERVLVTRDNNLKVEKINRLERSLAKLEARNKNLKNDFDQLKVRHEEAIEDGRRLGQENDLLLEQNEQLLERNNNREEQMNELQEQHQQLLESSNNRVKQINALQEKHQQLLERRKNREEQIAALLEQHQQLLERSNNREQQMEAMQQERTELLERQQKLFDKNTMLLNLLTTMEKTL